MKLLKAHTRILIQFDTKAERDAYFEKLKTDKTPYHLVSEFKVGNGVSSADIKFTTWPVIQESEEPKECLK